MLRTSSLAFSTMHIKIICQDTVRLGGGGGVDFRTANISYCWEKVIGAAEGIWALDHHERDCQTKEDRHMYTRSCQRDCQIKEDIHPSPVIMQLHALCSWLLGIRKLIEYTLN